LAVDLVETLVLVVVLVVAVAELEVTLLRQGRELLTKDLLVALELVA
jgi:hypothetical protein